MCRGGNTHGGGAQTNVNGLNFENQTSLDAVLQSMGFSVQDCEVKLGEKIIGWSVPKMKLYSKFLKPRNIDYKDFNSKQWQPDECFINAQNNVAYIIEKKYQEVPGSVDEKLPGCHFKKLEYEKLFSPLKYKVEYIYVFNNWFYASEYRDVMEYIIYVGCRYYFNEIPIDFLGIDI